MLADLTATVFQRPCTRGGVSSSWWGMGRPGLCDPLPLCPTPLLHSQRIGYLAASQCFHEGTDVIMLTTNQIRKVGASHPAMEACGEGGLVGSG